MISPIDICNQALAHLGDRRIHRIDEDAQETDAVVRYCAEYYEQTKQEVLAAHRWTFAKKAVALTRSVGDAIFKYTYSHVLPTDMMRFLEILEAEVVEPSVITTPGDKAYNYLTLPSTVSFNGEYISIGGDIIKFVSTPSINTNHLLLASGSTLGGEETAVSLSEFLNFENSSNPNVSFKYDGGYTQKVDAQADGLFVDVYAQNTGVYGNEIATTSDLTGAVWDAVTLLGGVDDVVSAPTYAYNRKVDRFKIVGNKVWSDIEDLGLFYISNLDDPDQWTPHFRACVARKLASYLAGPVADNPGEAQRLLDVYERVDLPNAQFYDAVQDASGENSDMETRVADSPLLRSRYREGYTLGNSSDEPITYP